MSFPMKHEDALVVLELPSITTLTLSALEKARDEKIRLFQPSEADSDQKWKILEAYDILDDYLHGKSKPAPKKAAPTKAKKAAPTKAKKVAAKKGSTAKYGYNSAGQSNARILNGYNPNKYLQIRKKKLHEERLLPIHTIQDLAEHPKRKEVNFFQLEDGSYELRITNMNKVGRKVFPDFTSEKGKEYKYIKGYLARAGFDNTSLFLGGPSEKMRYFPDGTKLPRLSYSDDLEYRFKHADFYPGAEEISHLIPSANNKGAKLREKNKAIAEEAKSKSKKN